MNLLRKNKKKKISISHIVNPVNVSQTSDLYIAQPVTFESMKRAKEFSKGIVKVSQYAVCYPEDDSIVPTFFRKTKNLERSILDEGMFKKYRKLPVLKDILDRLYVCSSADFFIYTNVDIALQPYFYAAVKKIIDQGHDAFVINRRTLPAEFENVAQIPLMYSTMGKSHIGHDCFVFRRNAYPEYILGKVGVGIPFVGRVLIWNLLANAKKFKEFKDLHLTFHIGEDKKWQDPKFKDYNDFNRGEATRVLKELDKNKNLIAFLKTHYPQYLTAMNL